MWAVPILCCIGCGVSLWLAACSRDRPALIIAGSLAVVWALANAAWLTVALWFLPVPDLALGVVAVSLWWATQARWVALIAHAAAVRLILHMLDFLTGHMFIVAYLHALNATFAWMLVVVASTGGGHARDILLRRIRGFRRGLSSASARGLIDGR